MALYGIVIGRGMHRGEFAFRRNKRQALQDAKKARARVYVMRREPEAKVWDAPTFIACSDAMVADYQPSA